MHLRGVWFYDHGFLATRNILYYLLIAVATVLPRKLTIRHITLLAYILIFRLCAIILKPLTGY